MKILITGGAGYIGSHTIVELLKNDAIEVISIDNFSNSQENVFDSIKEVTGKSVTNHSIDLRDKKKVKSFFEKEKNIEGIIHFAALKAVGESVEKPLLYYDNNINSMLNVLQYAKDCNCFIFSSSCTVYGNAPSLPVTEQTPLSTPESPYGYTKLVGERIVEDYTKQSRVKGISLRYFNPVGAHISGKIGENPLNKPNNLLPIITQYAAGITNSLTVFGNNYPTRDGTCIRDYIHVSDIANAHVLAMKYLINSPNSYDIFNLGSGNGSSVLEIIDAFEKSTGQKLNYTIGEKRPGDVDSIYSDSTKAKEKLGWETKFNTLEMMETAWKWQQNLLKKN